MFYSGFGLSHDGVVLVGALDSPLILKLKMLVFVWPGMTMIRRLKEPHEYVMAVTEAECVGPDAQVVVRQLPHGRSMIRP